MRTGQIWLLLASVASISSLEITRLTIPNYVQNGSAESVLLDCEYDYDVVQDKKLVVKWFHENDPEPVYQWIPELDSVLHSDRYRINVDYVIPAGSRYTRSRALNIMRPTTELSGRYSCHVTSMEGEDSKEACMVVYALPTRVNLNYTIAGDSVVVFCEVEGVFPLPEISLFQIGPGQVDPSPLDDVDSDHELKDGSAYFVNVATKMDEKELRSEGLRFFGCEVSLQGTDYEKVVKVPYFPAVTAEKHEGDDKTGSGICLQTHFSMITLLILVLMLT